MGQTAKNISYTTNLAQASALGSFIICSNFNVVTFSNPCFCLSSITKNKIESRKKLKI